MPEKLLVEMTKSKSGLHAKRCIAVVFTGGSAKTVWKPEKTDDSVKTYKVGVAGWVSLRERYDAVVHICLVRGPCGRIRGRLVVYDSMGRPVLEAVLRRRKLRRSRGNPAYSKYIEEAIKIVGLDKHVRKINMGTGEVWAGTR